MVLGCKWLLGNGTMQMAITSCHLRQFLVDSSFIEHFFERATEKCLDQQFRPVKKWAVHSISTAESTKMYKFLLNNSLLFWCTCVQFVLGIHSISCGLMKGGLSMITLRKWIIFNYNATPGIVGCIELFNPFISSWKLFAAYSHPYATIKRARHWSEIIYC